MKKQKLPVRSTDEGWASWKDSQTDNSGLTDDRDEKILSPAQGAATNSVTLETCSFSNPHLTSINVKEYSSRKEIN